MGCTDPEGPETSPDIDKEAGSDTGHWSKYMGPIYSRVALCLWCVHCQVLEECTAGYLKT